MWDFNTNKEAPVFCARELKRHGDRMIGIYVELKIGEVVIKSEASTSRAMALATSGE